MISLLNLPIDYLPVKYARLRLGPRLLLNFSL